MNANDAGTYSRVAVTTSTSAGSTPATQFAEVGWLKKLTFGIFTEWGPLAVYTDTNGVPQQYFVNRSLSSVPRYSIQYDPVNAQDWIFFENGVYFNESYGTNFTNGCAAVAGGEVRSNVESMGNTDFTYLQRGKINSQGVAYDIKSWNTNTMRLFQGNYTCTLVSNSHHRCGP